MAFAAMNGWRHQAKQWLPLRTSWRICRVPNLDLRRRAFSYSSDPPHQRKTLVSGYIAKAEMEVKRSKFIARACAVQSMDDAIRFVQETSTEIPGSNHYCWAAVVETDNGNVTRAVDAGEPGGTAGLPIQGAIESAGLTCTAVVVARWFGGVKLGAGGLVRAYKGSAALALEQAKKDGGIVPWVATHLLRVVIPCADVGLILHTCSLDTHMVEPVGTSYENDGTAVALFRGESMQITNLIKLISNISKGRAECEIIDGDALET